MRILLSLFIATNFVAIQAYGQADLPSNVYGSGVDDRGRTLNTPPKPQSGPSPTATPQATGSSGGSATREGSGSSSGGPSINPGAKQGEKSQGSGMGANLAAAAGLIAGAIPMMSSPSTTPMGVALLAMAVLGAIPQAAHDGSAAGQSSMTGNASSDGVGANGLTDGSNSASTNPDYNAGASAFAKEQSAKATDALAKAGYSITPEGLKAPDGTVTPSSAFSSPAAMSAAGMPAAAVAEAQKILAKVDQEYAKYHVSGVAVDTSGGGGGGSGSGSSSDSSEFSTAFSKYKNPFAITDSDKKQIVAGKTVLFDGEPIGVRGRNIFDMIHTAYQTKRTRNDFIESEGAAMRAPASVPRPASVQTTPQQRKR